VNKKNVLSRHAILTSLTTANNWSLGQGNSSDTAFLQTAIFSMGAVLYPSISNTSHSVQESIKGDGFTQRQFFYRMGLHYPAKTEKQTTKLPLQTRLTTAVFTFARCASGFHV
jgi:hypothetical protein